VQWAPFDVTAALPFSCKPAATVLAIQALNINATNTDFLMQAQLVAEKSIFRHGSGLGDIFRNDRRAGQMEFQRRIRGRSSPCAGHLPNVPQSTSQLVVTSRVAQAFSSISNVVLNYRVMFNSGNLPRP